MSCTTVTRRRLDMKPSEAIRIAWDAILKNKVRSLLTMLGIIIGVGAVIIMIAISAGTEATIQEEITSLGSNLVFVQGSMSRGGPFQASSGGLVYDDAAAIQEGVSGVVSVVVEQNSSETVKAGDVTLEDVELLGSTTGFPSVRDMTIAEGRYFSEKELERKSKVAVLG
ncbi:peptide ABC transporter permease, partial [bacterium]|nr:peptide ABC transporter permease [bacterium]